MTILNMYVTIMPVILGGIGNMIFTKTNLYKKNAKPMDGNRCLKDGRPIFGENKTWIGFWGMIAITGAMQILWGILSNVAEINELNQLYTYWNNNIVYNGIVGLLFGALYVLLELPNSFVKRRLNIDAGMTDVGIKGKIFFVIDQFDSIVGIGIALGILARISIIEVFMYILLGGITHILVNLILCRLKIRKNI